MPLSSFLNLVAVSLVSPGAFYKLMSLFASTQNARVLKKTLQGTQKNDSLIYNSTDKFYPYETVQWWILNGAVKQGFILTPRKRQWTQYELNIASYSRNHKFLLFHINLDSKNAKVKPRTNLRGHLRRILGWQYFWLKDTITTKNLQNFFFGLRTNSTLCMHLNQVS